MDLDVVMVPAWVLPELVEVHDGAVPSQELVEALDAALTEG